VSDPSISHVFTVYSKRKAFTESLLLGRFCPSAIYLEWDILGGAGPESYPTSFHHKPAETGI